MDIFDTTINQLLAEAVKPSEQTGPPYIVKDEFDNISYFKDRECDILHRDEKDPKTGLSLPAVTTEDGDKVWWKDGELHRDDGPAVERADGRVKWYVNGKLLSRNEFEEHKNKLAIKTEIQAHPNNRIDPDMLGEYL